MNDTRYATYGMRTPRILIVNPFGIGDVLFTTPMIEAVRKQYPQSFIGYVCNIRTMPIVSSDPRIDRSFVFEKDEYRHLWRISKRRCLSKLLRLLRDIRNERFDTVFDLSLAQEYGLFLKLGGIKRRIGYNFRGRGIFLTDRKKLEGGYYKRHMADYYISLLELAGIEKPKGLPHLSLSILEQDNQKAQAILSAKGITDRASFICIAPGGGSSWGGTSFRKQWPKENFLKLAKMLCSGMNRKVVLLGSKEDKQICEYISDREKNCIDLCGETDLLTSAAIISRARLLVTNDGGPLHIAVAAGTGTVSIFGPVDDKVYGPYPPDDKHIVIRNDSADCRPCYSNFKIPECRHRDCLEKISPDTVIEAVKKILE